MNGEIMTGVAKGWSVENSLTCKRALVQMYREKKWKRRSNFSNKYTEKGIEVEEDSITLYSLHRGEMFRKNTERITDDIFTGEYDLFLGESPTNATEIIDIKSSWDWNTFPSFLDTIDKDYLYQVQTYMALSGATKGVIAYCLVNTPMHLIDDQKRRLQWKLNDIDGNSTEYQQGCEEIEKNSIYDMEQFKRDFPGYDHVIQDWEFDIPREERVYEIAVQRDDKLIEQMRERCFEAREWMKLNLK